MTQEGLQLIISHEGFSPKAYWDRHGKKWTIGYGTTVYPNGQPVRKGETITREQAARALNDTIAKTIVPQINSMVRPRLNKWQLDALTSFAYNCGIGNLGKSTLLQKVNANPNDASIRDEFMRWNRAGGEALKGLTERRANEANLYFKGTRPDPNSPLMRQLSKDFRANSQEYLRRYAEKRRMEKQARDELSRQFRANSQEYLRRYAETQRAARNAGGGAVDENLVRKAVAEVVSERLREILG